MLKILRKKEIYYKYSGVYTYDGMSRYYSFYDIWARNESEVDRYVLNVMEDMELEKPYYKLSCHATEWKRM